MRLSSLFLTLLSLVGALAAPRGACRKTQVAILGGGTAGVTAGQALSNASIHDFVIIEYNDQLGGRVAHTTFGKKPDGSPYTVELGANWVQGLGTKGGPENPIWTLAKKYKVENTYSNYSDILTYNYAGYTDYSDLLDEFDDAYATLEQDAGYILNEDLQDRSIRFGLNLADWKPGTRQMAKQAVEWWEWDWEYAYSPDESSQEFGIVNYNTTFYQFSEANNYVFDQRGFNAFIKGEASSYLAANDPRLFLNTVVKNISYSDTGVTVYNTDGSCVTADHAICTFSLGVLQHAPNSVSFHPSLPDWKQTALETFQMGTYTKIFLQFNETFWPRDTQFFLYADPYTRGYYPVWQSLSAPGFLPESNIIFATVVHQLAYRAERMPDEAVQAELMAVLRTMFPNITVPEPTTFLMPRWSTTPWAYGSYSNWPAGTSLEMHQNLRANLGRLWFAGEATHPEYYGFLQAAWFEGRSVAGQIAQCLKNGAPGIGGAKCPGEVHYETLHGDTPVGEYDLANGWQVSSFEPNLGDD